MCAISLEGILSILNKPLIEKKESTGGNRRNQISVKDESIHLRLDYIR